MRGNSHAYTRVRSHSGSSTRQRAARAQVTSSDPLCGPCRSHILKSNWIHADRQLGRWADGLAGRRAIRQAGNSAHSQTVLFVSRPIACQHCQKEIGRSRGWICPRFGCVCHVPGACAAALSFVSHARTRAQYMSSCGVQALGHPVGFARCKQSGIALQVCRRHVRVWWWGHWDCGGSFEKETPTKTRQTHPSMIQGWTLDNGIVDVPASR